MDERDERDERDEAARAADAPVRPVPIGLVRLRQHFVEPVRENAKEIAAGGVVAGLAAVLGAGDDAPADEGGTGPSPTLRRMRWISLTVIAVLVVIFIVGGLLR
jgi:hypothetical protein